MQIKYNATVSYTDYDGVKKSVPYSVFAGSKTEAMKIVKEIFTTFNGELPAMRVNLDYCTPSDEELRHINKRIDTVFMKLVRAFEGYRYRDFLSSFITFEGYNFRVEGDYVYYDILFQGFECTVYYNKGVCSVKKDMVYHSSSLKRKYIIRDDFMTVLIGK